MSVTTSDQNLATKDINQVTPKVLKDV